MPKAAANRSKVDEFVDLLKRVPKRAFTEILKHSTLTVAEQRHLLRMFMDLK